MKSLHRSLMTVLALALGLTACSHSPPPGTAAAPLKPGTGPTATSVQVNPSTAPSDTEFTLCGCEPGNTNTNYGTHGCFAEKDGWIYYADASQGARLMRKRADDTQITDYNEKPVSSINVAGGWIYYIKRTRLDEAYIYRMTTEGKSIERISPIPCDYDSCANILVKGDYVFFSNLAENGSLYRMKTDGTELVRLNARTSRSLTLEGDWIYYVAKEAQGDELRTIRPDGSDDRLLAEEVCTNIIPYEGWIYYTSLADDQRVLMRMRLDGSGAMELLRDSLCGMTIYQDQLFYVIRETGRLYRAELDGSDPVLLMNTRAFGVQIAGGWIYFSNADDVNRPYRVRLDGSGMEPAYTVDWIRDDPEEPDYARGLGVPNSNAHSRFVRGGNWIYFSLDHYMGEIRKTLRNGISISTVIKRPGNHLNLSGHYLYFIDTGFYDCLARVRIDGTGYGIVADQSASELVVFDEWMYFVNQSLDQTLCRIRVDGTGLQQLTQMAVRNLKLDDEWIYFEPSLTNDQAGEEGIWKIRLDGSKVLPVTGQAIALMTLDQDWIYYTTESDHELRRMKTDATQDESINGETGTLYGIHQGWLYYYASGKDKGMVRFHLEDRTRELILGPGTYSLVHFLEDQIIYYNNDMNTYHMMEPDGSERREFKP